ncbi:MAG: hypothetical protein P8166_04830 [Candidatus Thiodiazotropha sp.]
MRRPLRHLAALLFAVLLLSASSTQPVVEAGYPSGVYAVKGQYIWDSWIVADEGILHRYALSTPTEGYGPNDRQQHADKSFTRWRLEPPMQLPQYYRQVEVPYMLHRGGNYDLFVSTQANPRMEENAGKEAAYRGYVSTNIDGPWKLIYTNSCSRRRAAAATTLRSPSSQRTPAAPSPAPPLSTSTGTPKGCRALSSIRTWGPA